MTAKKKSAKTKSKAKDEIVIPDRLYFRIGEVAELCRLPAYVLRFWETEFPQLKPAKSSTGQRMYRRRDVETVLEIRDLLHQRKFTIAGAKKWLNGEGRQPVAERQMELGFACADRKAAVEKIREGLASLEKMLD